MHTKILGIKKAKYGLLDCLEVLTLGNRGEEIKNTVKLLPGKNGEKFGYMAGFCQEASPAVYKERSYRDNDGGLVFDKFLVEEAKEEIREGLLLTLHPDGNVGVELFPNWEDFQKRFTRHKLLVNQHGREMARDEILSVYPLGSEIYSAPATEHHNEYSVVVEENYYGQVVLQYREFKPDGSQRYSETFAYLYYKDGVGVEISWGGDDRVRRYFSAELDEVRNAVEGVPT